MKWLINILLFFYKIWVFLVFTVFMFLLMPFFIIPILISERLGVITFGALKLWSWLFHLLTFIRYEIIGRENAVPGKAYIYTCNHTSFLDIPGITMAIRGQFRPLGKKELLKIPVFGLIVRVAVIIVDRSSPQSRRESLERLKRTLNSGISILIFPEGTQNRTNEPLQPFYDGAFRLALDTQQPILPVVTTNAGKLMPPGTIKLRPGKIKVIMGEPVDVRGYDVSDVKKLKEEVFRKMLSMVRSDSDGSGSAFR